MAARVRFSLLILINLITYIATTTAESNPSPEAFIKSSCQATRYPTLCIQSLLRYAKVIHQSERQLAITSLSVSISRTKSTASFVKNISKAKGIKPREYKAIQDCIENIGDSIDSLSQSVKELGLIGHAVGEDFVWHMSNVQTWVSAALTDDNTCLDGFAGTYMNGNVKAAIKDRIVNIAQVTSNALALVNRFASRHHTSTHVESP